MKESSRVNHSNAKTKKNTKRARTSTGQPSRIVLYSVSQIPLEFSGIFPKQLGIFSPNFTHLLRVPIYVRIQIFIQLPATKMKLCHKLIKCDHPACVSADSGHFESMMVVALNMA